MRKAAEQESLRQEDAQLKLGNWYAFGDGVESDQEEAVKWWKKYAEDSEYKYNEEIIKFINNLDAAKQGNVEAQNWLGEFYSRYGEANNMTEAVKWYRKAAEQGNADAQLSLWHCYLRNERGFAKDEVESEKWLRKAAENGNAEAQRVLWNRYSYKYPETKSNIKEALKWVKKLAAQGDEQGIKDLESYEKHREEMDAMERMGERLKGR